MRIIEVIGINPGDQDEEFDAAAPPSRASAQDGNQVLWALLQNAFTPDGRLKLLWTVEPNLAGATASGAGGTSMTVEPDRDQGS